VVTQSIVCSSEEFGPASPFPLVRLGFAGHSAHRRAHSHNQNRFTTTDKASVLGERSKQTVKLPLLLDTRRLGLIGSVSDQTLAGAGRWHPESQGRGCRKRLATRSEDVDPALSHTHDGKPEGFAKPQ